MIIILDGPEKAGKSTIAKAIIDTYGGRIRHWGHVEPDDRRYAEPLAEDCASGDTVVWDRSWAAEHVYGRLLNRDRRLAHDPWLGEWLYGRAVMAIGIRVMVLGPSVESAVALRDSTDLPVDPREERMAFFNYAQHFGWMSLMQLHTADGLVRAARTIRDAAAENIENASRDLGRLAYPPGYAGPNVPSIIFVGDERNEAEKFPGAWLPFTTPSTIAFARMVPESLKAGWATTAAIPPQRLRRARTIVACGTKAHSWVKYHVDGGGPRVIHLPHPTYALRVDTAAGRKAKRQLMKGLGELNGGPIDTSLLV